MKIESLELRIMGELKKGDMPLQTHGMIVQQTT